jgi:hypothetical protein
MNRLSFVCLLIPAVLLSGCAGATSDADAALHHYQLYGDSAQGQFMVDVSTGAVWQYQRTPDGTPGFVRIPVVNRMEQIKTAFDPLRHSSVAPSVYLANGVIYEVMLSREAEFLKIHPDARKVAEIGMQSNADPITASNATGNRIISHDGGKTWTDEKTGNPVR